MIDREELLLLFKQKKDSTKETRELILYSLILVFVLFVTMFINTAVLSNVYVIGDSMNPTLQTDDVLYINKIVKPDYYDIIVLKVVENKDPYIKRVIGLGGDTVKCSNGIVQIKHKGETDFVTVDSTYAQGVTPDFYLEVGENEVCFLGDNRGNSEDSTELGCRSLDNVIGVVTKWSLKHKNFLKELTEII